ncbi:MAG: hypothetical protein Q7J76_03865 [Candidatus Brocadiaceae bacterium]|uniref:hypothetical protein n=1 Tax=Candidatus Wunengus sp. YC61 TaxID=3367698 RepID=UPI002718BB10|nr:hypothetical protein [Candidatus Brocadiaceae bacterium]
MRRYARRRASLGAQDAVVPRWRGCRGWTSFSGCTLGVENHVWKIESRHNKQLRLQQKITAVRKQAAEGNDEGRGMSVKIRLACRSDEGVSIQKAKAGAAIYS